jgi:hypothetical protein
MELPPWETKSISRKPGNGSFQSAKVAYWDLLTRFCRFLPLLAAFRSAPNRRQQPIDGGRTGDQKALPNGGIESQVTVLFQGSHQIGQDRFETLATDPVCRLPEDDKRFANCLVSTFRWMIEK